ncbi:MAG: hypothetical protein IPL55_03565 [Saprospiraceae bacterium]|nr:hypothetical protein [Saprospiraceae bacterium]MBL0025824.1 hypothetical protein [Saprospiraceae bacterium]
MCITNCIFCQKNENGVVEHLCNDIIIDNVRPAYPRPLKGRPQLQLELLRWGIPKGMSLPGYGVGQARLTTTW